MSAASRFVESKIRQRKVMMFTKRRDPACQLARRTLERYSLTPDVYEICDIDRRHDCNLIENHFLVICLVSQRCVSVCVRMLLYPSCSDILTLRQFVLMLLNIRFPSDRYRLEFPPFGYLPLAVDTVFPWRSAELSILLPLLIIMTLRR